MDKIFQFLVKQPEKTGDDGGGGERMEGEERKERWKEEGKLRLKLMEGKKGVVTTDFNGIQKTIIEAFVNLFSKNFRNVRNKYTSKYIQLSEHINIPN